MFKRLLLLSLTLSCCAISLKAQDTLARYIPDHITRKGSYACGTTADYIASKGVASGGGSSGAPGIIVPSLFPAAAIDTCGVFRVFYEDIAGGTLKGFHDPVYGLARRAAMCAAISYIQSQFDFSSIGAGHYIRMHVDSSYTSSYRAPFKTEFLARAAPYHSTAPGVTNGFVHDFIVSGVDPAATPDDYHSSLQVNFDATFSKDPSDSFLTTPIPINWYNGTGPLENCKTDLLSNLIHEISHTLGWISFVHFQDYPVTGTTVYTSIDTSIHVTDHHTSFSSFGKAISSGTIAGYYDTKHFWINGSLPPNNHPVFTIEQFSFGGTVTTSFSHLDGVTGSYAYRQRNSPGDAHEYVMNAFIPEGIARREYTKGELETLHNILGYTYTTGASGSTVVTNHAGWSSKMSSAAYDALYETHSPTAFPDLLPADTTINNDSGVVYVIHLWRDTTLHDADGDSLSVMPGSLVNFRGCGEGGNNHNLLTVTDGGKTITYTPRHNFYGRAQFGFSLFDGHERGGFMLYTIDVNRGNKVKGVPGTNLVLNGDFEEGTEVKIRGTDEGVNNTASENSGKKNGRLFGAHFSDSHPFDYFMNAWMPFGGGTAIKYAIAACDSTATRTSGFGVYTNAFPAVISFDVYGMPLFDGRVHPLAKDDVGDRYQPIRTKSPGYIYLADSLKSCHKYILEFDYYNPDWMYFGKRMKPNITIGFTDSAKADFAHMTYSNYDTRPLNYKLEPVFSLTYTSEWSHAKLTFNYCNDTASTILYLNAIAEAGSELMVDNISIIEDTAKTTVTILDSFMAPCSDTRLYAKAEHASLYHCLGTGPVEYTWTANGDTISRDSIIYRTPLTTTTYIAYIGDGCHIYSDTIILSPATGPVVVGSDTTICKDDSVHFNLAVSGTVGTVTYAWAPSTGLSCTGCANPLASPDTTTTYWVTVTDDVSCFKQHITIVVRPLPEIYVTSYDICYNTIATLNVTDSGSGPYAYHWLDAGLACDTCMTVYSYPLLDTTTFLVSATDIHGCHITDSTTVDVFPPPVIVISPPDTILCIGDTITLHATGGSPAGYHWEPVSPDLSCMDCSDPKAYPLHDMKYIVRGSSALGCEGRDSILITVLPLPVIIATGSADTVCPNGTLTLNGSGGVSYSWKRITADVTGIVCPTCATTNATVYTATKYILTGVDANRCSNKDTVSVELYTSPVVTVSPSSLTTCEDDSTGLITASGAITYSWTPAAGLGCSTCASTKAASATSTTLNYTVYGTDAHGCVNSDIVEVIVNDCPCGPRTVFGTSSTTLTGTIASNLSSGYYYIDADITIAGNPTFTGAKILVAADVTITVSDTTKLTLDSCHFMACPMDTKLWKGIVLSRGSTKSARIEVKNNTLIEDAYIAIKAVAPFTPSSGDVIKTNDAVFNRNVQSIYIENYTTSASTYPFSITKTVFTARKFNDTVVTGYPGTWPNQAFLKAKITNNGTFPPFYIDKNYAKANCRNNYPAEHGIRLINVGSTSGSGSGVSYKEIVIGDGIDSSLFNLYDNIGCGINAYNTNLTSFNNTFICIKKAVGYPHLGMGISAITDKSFKARVRVIEAPYNMPPVNRFYDCVTGVNISDCYEVWGKQSFMTSSHTYGTTTPGAFTAMEGIGYLVKGSFYKNIDLLENQISNIHLGISVLSDNSKSSYSDGSVTIKDNIIRNRNPLAPSGASTTGQYVYQAIKVQNVVSGVCATCGGAVTGGVYVKRNIIDSVYNGIDVLNFKVQNPQVDSNNIWLFRCPDNKRQAGVSQSNSAGTISRNNVSGTSVATIDTVRAFYIAQNTRPSVVSNYAINVGRGFEFVGTQTNTGWFCNHMQGNSKGYVLNGIIGPQGGTSSPYGTVHDNKWDLSWGGKQQTYSLGVTYPTNSILYVKGVTSPPSATQPTFNSSELLLSVYRYDVSNGIVISSPQAGSACAGPFTSPKQFTGVMHNLIARGTLTYDHDDAINSWMSQYELYHDLVVDDTLVSNSTQLQTFMTAASSSRFGWLTEIENALTEEDTTTAESLLNSPVSAAGYVVVDTDVVLTDTADADYIVQNFVDFYGIYLNYLKGASIDSPTLFYLSNLCPLTNGTVVYQARSLYSNLYDYNEGYDEDSLCEMNSYARLVRPVAIQQYGLYPNPNEGDLTVTQKVKDDEPVAGEVYNLSGQRVYKGELHFAGGIVHLHLGNISPGIYILRLKDNAGTKFTHKFLVK